MATVTKPIALDESFNTTEVTPRNIADVLAEGLSHITGRTASEVEYDNSESGLDADNVQDALDEINGKIPTVPSVDIQTAVDEFETYNGGLLSECKVALSPNQDLHGYDNPWVGGAGKNLLPNNLTTETVYDVTYETQEDGSIEGNGTSTGWANANLVNDLLLMAGTYILSGTTITGAYISVITIPGGDDYSITGVNGNRQITFETDTHVMVRISAKPATVLSNAKYYPMIRLATESDPTFEPYSNICPISGHTQVDVDVSDGQTTQEQVTVNLGGTYYSGTLDVVSGVFTPDTASVEYDGSNDENITVVENDRCRCMIECPSDSIVNSDGTKLCGLISNEFEELTNNDTYLGQVGFHIRANGTHQIVFALGFDSGLNTAEKWRTWLSNNPVMVVYPLANPTSIQLFPTMVKALVGENHLSAPLEGQEITESKYKQMFTFDDVIAYIQSLS